MKKKKYAFSGGGGIVALVLAIGCAAFQFSSYSEITDQGLRRDLALRLSEGADRRFADQLQTAKDTGDLSTLGGAIEELREPVVFHKIKASSPLLEWSSTSDVIVRVEYSLKNQGAAKMQTKYLRYKKRAWGNWEYRGSSSEASYYMNFF